MKRVILVEDEPLIAMTLVDMIDELGYECKEYPSPQAALAALEDDPKMDFLFTDLNLPGMNGDQLVRAAERKASELACDIIDRPGGRSGYS